MTRSSVPFEKRCRVREVARIAVIAGIGVACAPVIVGAVLLWAYCAGGGDISPGR